MAKNSRILYYYGRFEHGPKRHITMIACYTKTLTSIHLPQTTYFNHRHRLQYQQRQKSGEKNDWLTEPLLQLQTSWFVMQCIERTIEHLLVNHLEIVTLAYAAMYFVIYVFWWNKSLNVKWPVPKIGSGDRYRTSGLTVQENLSRARRSPRSKDPSQTEIDLWGNRQWLGNLITGCQGEYVNLSREDRVPEFWTDSDDFAIADLIVLSVGTCFGAIRCIACFFSYSFWAFGMLFGATKVQSCPVFWSILGPNFGQVQVCRSNLRLSSLYLFAKISRKIYIASILLRCQ